MDDVTFGRNGPYGDACRCDTGAESDVYECLVYFLVKGRSYSYFSLFSDSFSDSYSNFLAVVVVVVALTF